MVLDRVAFFKRLNLCILAAFSEVVEEKNLSGRVESSLSSGVLQAC